MLSIFPFLIVGSMFCVFVCVSRWHSPRDWVQDADGKFGLSPRMLQEGNIWQELWVEAGPMPVSRQVQRIKREWKEGRKEGRNEGGKNKKMGGRKMKEI